MHTYKFCRIFLNIRNSTFNESVSTYAIIESQEVCDGICKEAKQRFAFIKLLITAEQFYREYFPNYYEKIPISEIKELCNIHIFIYFYHHKYYTSGKKVP